MHRRSSSDMVLVMTFLRRINILVVNIHLIHYTVWLYLVRCVLFIGTLTFVVVRVVDVLINTYVNVDLFGHQCDTFAIVLVVSKFDNYIECC